MSNKKEKRINEKIIVIKIGKIENWSKMKKE